jgi:hypothetical protein
VPGPLPGPPRRRPRDGRAGPVGDRRHVRRAPTRLAEELHGRLEEIRHQPEFMTVQVVQRKDGLHRVIAIPGHELADVGPVFLLDVGVVVLLVVAAAGELDAMGLAVMPQVVVDELAPIIGVDAAQGEAQRARRSSSGAALTKRWPLLRTARDSTQPVWISVRLRDWANSPSAESPEWETKSISVKSGVVTFRCSVRTGMWCLSKVPGLVRPYRRRRTWRLRAWRRRSIVRGLIVRSWRSTAAGMVGAGEALGRAARWRTFGDSQWSHRTL